MDQGRKANQEAAEYGDEARSGEHLGRGST